MCHVPADAKWKTCTILDMFYALYNQCYNIYIYTYIYIQLYRYVLCRLSIFFSLSLSLFAFYVFKIMYLDPRRHAFFLPFQKNPDLGFSGTSWNLSAFLGF